MNHSIFRPFFEGLEATMHVDEALDGSEIIVLAVPSSVILNVVEDIIPNPDQDMYYLI